MKSAIIKLNQFPDFRKCTYVEGLVSLSKDMFKKTAMIGDMLFLQFDPKEVDHEYNLEVLSEQSSMDFTYYVADGSIEEISERLLNVIQKR